MPNLLYVLLFCHGGVRPEDAPFLKGLIQKQRARNTLNGSRKKSSIVCFDRLKPEAAFNNGSQQTTL